MTTTTMTISPCDAEHNTGWWWDDDDDDDDDDDYDYDGPQGEEWWTFVIYQREGLKSIPSLPFEESIWKKHKNRQQ